MARTTVLVTGGAGFIGSHVVDRLLVAGERPLIFDVRPSPYHPAVPAVLGDLADLEALTDAMRGCRAVLHLAAAADVNEVQADPVASEERNARGTLHVLEAARRAGVERVVYASTIWVYSDTEADVHVEDMPLGAPAHLYTATKLAGEHYCRAYGELYGVETTVLRFGIPYGPRARPAAVIPAFVGKALAGEPLTVAGDGSQSRRFVYVEDLADGVVRALRPGAAGRTYNLVSSADVTIAEIADTVRGVVGDVEVVRVPGRTGDYAGAPVSGERAARELGWVASTPFHEGVRRYVEWHRGELEAAAPAAVAAPAAAATPRRARLPALARRAAVAVACAAAVGIMVLGLVTLAPLDNGVDADGFVTTLLVLLTPILLAAGFDWDAAGRRLVRFVCSAIAVVAVAPIVVPWPPSLDHFGHAHWLLLVGCAVSGLVAASLARPVAPLRSAFSSVGT